MAPAIIETREFRHDLNRMMQAMTQDSRSQTDALFRKGFGVLMAGMAAWIVYQLFTVDDPGRILGGLAVGLAVCGVMTFVFGWVIPRLSENASFYKKGLSPRRYRFDAESLSLETVDGVMLRAPYRTFTRIALHPDWILFYEAFPTFATHAIPGDAFESKEQENVVREWLGPYVK
jgi:hypothetical protein